MIIGNHMEGFELKGAYAEMFGSMREYHPDLKYWQLYLAIKKIAPDFIEAVHERKDCTRNLRYVGCSWCAECPSIDDGFFELGRIYIGTSFNGATYTIEGYDDLIGCAYFEWIR